MFVYFIQAGGTDGPIKIGYSNAPEKRLRSLQTSHHENLTLLGSLSCSRKVEKALHTAMQNNHIRGEWYRPTPEVLQLVQDAALCSCDDKADSVLAKIYRHDRLHPAHATPIKTTPVATIQTKNKVKHIIRLIGDLSLTAEERSELIARLASPSGACDPRAQIEAALRIARGNVRRAAESLGYSRRGLQYRMRQLGMPPQKKGAKFKVG